MNSRDAILVFDSGLGGISVLRQLQRLMPGERYLYFGDSLHTPYGSKNTKIVRELTLTAVESVLNVARVKAIVIACNTATAAAIDALREKYPQRIIIGIEPALKLAVDSFPQGNIGVMATEVTLREEKFAELLQRYQKSHSIVKIPAPGLVELIEGGLIDSREALDFLETRLGPYRGKLSALVLGCTHYPFASRGIRQILGDSVALLDGAEGTARETRRRLEEANLLENGPGSITFHSSAESPQFYTLANTLLEQTL